MGDEFNRRPLKERLNDYYEGKSNRKHLHKLRKMSFGDHIITGQQLEAIKKVLAEDRTKRMNKVEKEWAKRKQRRILGLQHRRLQGGWKFLQPIRKLLPRKVKIDNYKPDYVFYFCNVMIFLSCGLNYGVATALRSLELVLVRIGGIVDKPTAQRYEEFPLLKYSEYHAALDVLIMVMAIIGINVVYAAMKGGLWTYFFVMLGAIFAEAALGTMLYERNFCDVVAIKTGEKFDSLVKEYYHSVPAVDEDGRRVMDPDGDPFMTRTLNAAIMMDKIQQYAGCCGSSGYKDYLHEPDPLPSTWIAEVPQSCCTALWKANLECAKEIPEDPEELQAKINIEGCQSTMTRICENAHLFQSLGAINMAVFHLTLFFISFLCIGYQLRQIRQLERPTHFHIPGEAATRKLQRGLLGQFREAMNVEDTTNLSDDVLSVINSFRKALGLENLGKNMRAWVPKKPNYIELVEPVYIPFSKTDVDHKKAAAAAAAKKASFSIPSRLDLYDIKNLKPYYRGLFSATYEQENKAAKVKIMKDMKDIPELRRPKSDVTKVKGKGPKRLVPPKKAGTKKSVAPKEKKIKKPSLQQDEQVQQKAPELYTTIPNNDPVELQSSDDKRKTEETIALTENTARPLSLGGATEERKSLPMEQTEERKSIPTGSIPTGSTERKTSVRKSTTSVATKSRGSKPTQQKKIKSLPPTPTPKPNKDPKEDKNKKKSS